MNILNAFKLLEEIQKVSKEAQEEYREYIETHKENVSKAAEWLKENLPELFEEVNIEKFDELIAMHDNSKYSEEEFLPYTDRWHGSKKKTKEYALAWEHHWKNNPHHPEYYNGEDMEYIYILEMICDWMSFGFKENDLTNIISFYREEAREDKEKNFSENTIKILDEIINKIEEKLAELETPLDEGYSRHDLISRIINLGYSYKFNNYSDAQLFRIWQQLKEKPNEPKVKNKSNQIDNTNHKYCPKCNKVFLNDAGECPFCDLGDESVLEEKINTFSDCYEELNKINKRSQ